MTNRHTEALREAVRNAQWAVDRYRADKEAARTADDSSAFFSAAGRLDEAILRLRSASERLERWNR